MKKLEMRSKNLVDENINKIAELFPNCITEGHDENGKLTNFLGVFRVVGLFLRFNLFYGIMKLIRYNYA